MIYLITNLIPCLIEHKIGYNIISLILSHAIFEQLNITQNIILYPIHNEAISHRSKVIKQIVIGYKLNKS